MLSVCKEKGKIATMPDVPGVLVFMSGHVGVYIGGGEVIEARGHEYGVIKIPSMGKLGKMPMDRVSEVYPQSQGRDVERPNRQRNKLQGGLCCQRRWRLSRKQDRKRVVLHRQA